MTKKSSYCNSIEISISIKLSDLLVIKYTTTTCRNLIASAKNFKNYWRSSITKNSSKFKKNG